MCVRTYVGGRKSLRRNRSNVGVVDKLVCLRERQDSIDHLLLRLSAARIGSSALERAAITRVISDINNELFRKDDKDAERR